MHPHVPVFICIRRRSVCTHMRPYASLTHAYTTLNNAFPQESRLPKRYPNQSCMIAICNGTNATSYRTPPNCLFHAMFLLGCHCDFHMCGFGFVYRRVSLFVVMLLCWCLLFGVTWNKTLHECFCVNRTTVVALCF